LSRSWRILNRGNLNEEARRRAAHAALAVTARHTESLEIEDMVML
jgi:hypothetical protein